MTCVAWSASDDIKVLNVLIVLKFRFNFKIIILFQIVTCADDVRHRVWRTNHSEEANAESDHLIRGRAHLVDTQIPIAKSCEEALTRIKLKTNAPLKGCNTPVPRKARAANRTPDILAVTPRSTDANSSTFTPRIALSPISNQLELTPNQSGSSSSNRAAASRRLHMEIGDYSSPTRDLPNYVADGTSPHSRISSGTKRKKLDLSLIHI